MAVKVFHYIHVVPPFGLPIAFKSAVLALLVERKLREVLIPLHLHHKKSSQLAAFFMVEAADTELNYK